MIMSVKAQKVERVEGLRRSLSEASAKVRSWAPSKHASAHATVDSKRLASYYESVVAARKSRD